MKLDIPDDYFPLLITALEQYYAYTKAVRREDSRDQQAADWFHRQRTAVAVKPERTVKRKGHAPQVRRPNATR
jgi:chromatin segregation and condensation protein Rec8/ScpA/Scc1 (kleisin family)